MSEKKHCMFNLDSELHKRFKEVCENNSINMSKVLEALMAEVVLDGKIIKKEIEQAVAKWLLNKIH